MEAMLKFFCGVVWGGGGGGGGEQEEEKQEGMVSVNSKNIFKGSLWMVSLKTGPRELCKKEKDTWSAVHPMCRSGAPEPLWPWLFVGQV